MTPKPKPPVLEPVKRLPSRRRRADAPAAGVPPRPGADPAGGPAAAVAPTAALPAARPAGVPVMASRPFINLCGDYRFLRAGYWALVDAELNGIESSPTPVQAATAQNAAACLLVARHNGIETAAWNVARTPEEVAPPSFLIPVAGLTEASYEVTSVRSRAKQWRSATQNGTRPAIAVRKVGELRSMRMIVGVTANDNFHLAWDVWRTFGVPLATIWYMEAPPALTPEPTAGPAGVAPASADVAAVSAGTLPTPVSPASASAGAGLADVPARPLFVGLDPLPLHELTERELRLYEEVSQRPMVP